ncbi:FAS1-like dehydratase domain-containing protein [Verticiella sediminum]|uniref:FAS1-like dehydratase domain-containing protein n=1 Tax=Verticiella sediminum TaxID=1247510 RepID=UPI0014787F60|nr:MaoC family dehydratase N-terminal domain-containing protein [Verticiella sediminum]
MNTLMQQLAPYIGLQSEITMACDPVEAGAVRRHAQATMDENRAYADDNAPCRYATPVAPPLFPSLMFRRAFGAPDPVQMRAQDPHYDGSVTAGSNGLPSLAPLHGYGVLNGGAEIELYRYARHGEQVCTRSRYADIREKEGRKGPMVVVIVENDYSTAAGELLLRVKRTYLWSRK